jgi:hypothetical protein
MSEKRGWGKTVLGWFVVGDESEKGAGAAPTEESADDIIARYANASAEPTPSPVQLTGDVPRPQGGQIDLPKVYEAAGISAEEQERITRASDLLKSLPADTPIDTKRKIVEASLKAFGYPVDAIIEAGAQEIQALEAYNQREAHDTQRTLADATKRIEQLTQDIADLRKLMQTAVDEQNATTAGCNNAKLAVQQVLEFFGQEAVAKVVQASPKLVEPAK